MPARARPRRAGGRCRVSPIASSAGPAPRTSRVTGCGCRKRAAKSPRWDDARVSCSGGSVQSVSSTLRCATSAPSACQREGHAARLAPDPRHHDHAPGFGPRAMNRIRTQHAASRRCTTVRVREISEGDGNSSRRDRAQRKGPEAGTCRITMSRRRTCRAVAFMNFYFAVDENRSHVLYVIFSSSPQANSEKALLKA